MNSPFSVLLNPLFFYYTEGFKESAEKFKVESGIQLSMDLNELDDRIRIREEIQKGCIESAISLVNSLHPELLDNDRYLYFHLQVKVVSSLPNKKILDWTKFKAFTDNKINVG